MLIFFLIGGFVFSQEEFEVEAETESATQIQRQPQEEQPPPAATLEKPLEVEAATQPLETAAPATPPAIEYETYTVERGDTLSGIAFKKLGSAEKWKELHKLNKDTIKNPHRIYPGQVIKIAFKKPLVREEAPPTAIIQAPALKLPPEYKTKFTGDSFIAGKDWEFDGYIIGFRDDKLLLSEGDVLYVDMGWRQGVMPKSRFLVYKKGADVIHPETKSSYGYIIKRVAIIEATNEVGEDVSSCKIVRVYEPVEVGDFVRLLKTEEYIETIK